MEGDGDRVAVEARLRTGMATVVGSAYRPPTRQRGVIDRYDVVKGLLQTEDARVVVVCAPAGYGKTTTLGLWDDADERPFAWVHLDTADGDPCHLVRHIALAMNVIEPIDPAVVRALAGPGRVVEADMMPALGRWLESRTPFVLVLDDLHVLTNGPALHVVERLIAYLPERSLLVLTGRTMPDLPLARQRMHDRIADLGAADLAMTDDEAARVFAHLGVAVDDADLGAIVRRTEGWPGGIHLAALALLHDAASCGSIASGRDRLIADYLIEEVLGGLPVETVEFLERSAVLERMSPALLDDLLGIDDAASRLRALERSGNMFLVPLDRDGGWCRYHHLFGEVLRARLRDRDAALALRLESVASRLLEETGDIDAAIRHASNAGEIERVADLILAGTSRLVFQGQVVRLGRWLDLIGRRSMHEMPAAAIAWAWYGMAIGDRTLIIEATLAAERSHWRGALADGSPSVAVAVAAVRAITALAGLPGILRDTDLVRGAGGPATNPWWTLATVTRATALSMLGDLDGAHDLLAASLPMVTDSPGLEAVALAHLALIALQRGDRHEADRLVTKSLDTVDRHDLEAVTIMIPVFAVGALVAARRGRADESRRAAGKAQLLLARLDGLAPRTLLFGSLLLAQAALALDRRAEARVFAEEAERARRRDQTATHLNQQLDEVRDQLASGALLRTGGAPSLSRAELRVLPYLTTNLSLQDIADQLLISRNTAKSHSVSIYRKLGVSSRREAVLEARRVGLLAG